MIRERQALSIIEHELSKVPSRQVKRVASLSIGDDCAVMRSTSVETVWTIDSCSEGSHFRWEWMKPEDVAHKSFHAAVSDVCAMGARPSAAVVHLTLSARVTPNYLRRFAREQARLCNDTGVSIVGGNVSAGESLSVVTSVMGRSSDRLLRRDGARPGHEVWLLGTLGLARAGLLLLQNSRQTPRGEAARHCLEAFRRPRARLDAVRVLGSRASACLDVSDGLSRDAQNLANSSGVQVIIFEEALDKMISPSLRRVSRKYGWDAFELALQGGEDYALLAAGPAENRPRGVQVVGTVVRGRGVILRSDKSQVPIDGGFEH